MSLKELMNKNLFITDLAVENKKELFEKAAKTLKQEGRIDDEKSFIQSLEKREEEGTTALESGVAIPHGKGSSVKKTSVVFISLKKPIAWDKENYKTDIVFLLAVSEAEKNSIHIDILSQVATLLLNDNFTKELRSFNNIESLLKAIDKYAEEKKNKESKTDKNAPLIVAVSACATGIAHTYMAAEAMEKAAEELGVRIKIEKQGANGIEDKLSKTDIENSIGIILASDIALQETSRFNNKQCVEVRVAEALKHPKDLLKKIINKEGRAYTSEAGESTKEKGKVSWVQAIMTGISYMIPVLVAAGVIMGIAKVGAMAFGLQAEIGKVEHATNPNHIIVLLHYMDLFGGMVFRFMYPMFAMFAAYSIANRAGIISGFLGGIFSSGLYFSLTGKSGVPSGFIGAALLGLFAGYFSKFLNEKIKLPENFKAMKPMFLVPSISVLAIFFLNFYIVDPVIGAFNMFLQNFIRSLQSSGTLTLSSVIAAATAFDLGGPVNKAAGAIAIGLAADKVFPLTPRVLSIVIPPIGLGLATVLDKYIVRRRVFKSDLQVAGRTSLLLGFLAISEGALPFMLANPLITIPINILGAIIGSCTAVALGAVQWYPIPAIWGWPLVEKLPIYLLGLFSGALFIALSNIFIRYYLIVKKGRDI